MNEQIDNAAINARVFRAFYSILQSEGFSEDEAYQLSKRGTDLLTASGSSAPISGEKPAAAAAGCEAADNEISDRPYTYFFSKLTFTRRLALTACMVLLALTTGTIFSALLELAKASRTERSVGRSAVPQHRKVNVLLSVACILFVFFGLMIFTMPSL